MSDKFLKQFLIVNSSERKTKTKGFVEKTMQLRKNGKSKISLGDVKKLAEYFDKEADKKGGKYIIMGVINEKKCNKLFYNNIFIQNNLNTIMYLK
jgi:hypothetical protein